MSPKFGWNRTKSAEPVCNSNDVASEDLRESHNSHEQEGKKWHKYMKTIPYNAQNFQKSTRLTACK